MAEKKIGYVTNAKREETYMAQTGRKELTARQRRRLQKKAHQGKA
jgi:hypothetical protein